MQVSARASSCKTRYLSADELPESREGLRESYRDIGLLVIDNLRKSLHNEGVKRLLWVVYDEVLGHGGKVLLLAEETAVVVFGDDKDIMELIWSGKVKDCWDRSDDEDKDEGRLEITTDGWSSWDLRPYAEYARHMRIDEVDTSDGRIVIWWSCPGEDTKKHTLYLYYADGKWHRDEEDGFSDNEGVAALVLKKASGQIIAQTDEVDHIGQHFWGWGW